VLLQSTVTAIPTSVAPVGVKVECPDVPLDLLLQGRHMLGLQGATRQQLRQQLAIPFILLTQEVEPAGEEATDSKTCA
jgi:hypothetical protein